MPPLARRDPGHNPEWSVDEKEHLVSAYVVMRLNLESLARYVNYTVNVQEQGRAHIVRTRTAPKKKLQMLRDVNHVDAADAALRVRINNAGGIGGCTWHASEPGT
ncbi:hypothetical protein FOA52_011000 [Chlamydomonas sp. UWO 241]|nr:hypothetical protein FOA52_011000 [Chlamydomonas sp. UWO 241]